MYAGGKLLRDPKDLLPLNESTPYTLTIRFQLGEAAKGDALPTFHLPNSTSAPTHATPTPDRHWRALGPFKGTFLAQAPSEKSKTGKSLGRGIWKNGGDVQVGASYNLLRLHSTDTEYTTHCLRIHPHRASSSPSEVGDRSSTLGGSATSQQ